MNSPNYFLLTYHVAPNYLVDRAAFRREHLELANEFVDKGQLLLGGAFDDIVDAAVLAFQASDMSVVEDFVRRDPYVKNKLVSKFTIRKWKVVVGTACTNPIKLESLS